MRANPMRPAYVDGVNQIVAFLIALAHFSLTQFIHLVNVVVVPMVAAMSWRMLNVGQSESGQAHDSSFSISAFKSLKAFSGIASTLSQALQTPHHSDATMLCILPA